MDRESYDPFSCEFRANIKGTPAMPLIALFNVEGVPETASKLIFIVLTSNV